MAITSLTVDPTTVFPGGSVTFTIGSDNPTDNNILYQITGAIQNTGTFILVGQSASVNFSIPSDTTENFITCSLLDYPNITPATATIDLGIGEQDEILKRIASALETIANAVNTTTVTKIVNAQESIAKSLEAMTATMSIMTATMSATWVTLNTLTEYVELLTELTTGSGIRVTGPYDWVEGVNLYNWAVGNFNTVNMDPFTTTEYTNMLSSVSTITNGITGIPGIPKFL